jgi:RNA polymerase sigma-70 factor (ECF subfamily)
MPSAHPPVELPAVADSTLVERMTRGDRSALAALYNRHAPIMLALAHRLLGTRQDAEDLTHDVFLEAWQHCTEYSEERSSVRSWLLLRARSRAVDRLRSTANRRRIAVNTVQASESEPSIPRHALASDDRHRLPDALAHMPESQQHVIALSYFEGLSTVEISLRLGIPTGTVKSRTHAAIATLRHVLGVGDE